MNMSKKLKVIRDTFHGKKVLVLLSGGVDSSVLLYLAKKYAKEVIALTLVSDIFRGDLIERAKKFAKELGVKHILVDFPILSYEEYIANTSMRCYICKRKVCELARKIAEENGIDIIADGTNYSDLSDNRPGLIALKEYNIVSPFVDAKIKKEEIRKLAKELNIEWYNDPPESCYATRIIYGKITRERIRRIAKAEDFLRKEFKLKLVRVRDHGEIARIELSLDDIHKLSPTDFPKIVKKIKSLGFKYVTLDLAGYHSEILNSEKLVRDKIPCIAKKKARIASKDEVFVFLKRKLIEEAHEFYRNPTLEELADMYQVIEEILRMKGQTFESLIEFKKKKAIERGAFSKGYVIKIEN